MGKNQLLIKNAPIAIYEIDFHVPKFTKVNDAMCQLMGYTRKEFLSINPYDILDTQSAALFKNRTRKLLSGEKIDKNIEYTVCAKDGHKIYASLDSTVIYKKDVPVGALVVAYDITGSKKIENELFFKQNQFNSLIQNTTSGVALINEFGAFEIVNQAFLKIFGLSENLKDIKNANDQNWSEWQVFDENDILLNLDDHPVKKALLTKKTVKNVKVKMKRPSDNNYVWLSITAEPILKTDGNILMLICNYNDITESILKEKELLRLNRTLRALSNSNYVLLNAKDEKTLLYDVCKIINNDCNYSMVWVGMAENDKAKNVHPIAYSGFEEGYLETLKITWADTKRGRGPTGKAIRTGKTCFCRNMLTDPSFLPWRDQALKRGYASSIVIPLISEEKTFGSLTIYSKEPDPFSKNEVKLLEELTNNLAIGINTIRLNNSKLKAEAALKKSQGLYEELVNNARSVIVKMNSQGRLTFINEYGENFFGYKYEELIGKKLIGLIVPETDSNGKKLEPMVNSIYKNPDGFQTNINENINKNGDRFWFEWHNKAIYDESGQRTSHISVGIDITDRVKSEKEKNYLASFPRLNTTPIIEININGQINYTNPAASDLFPDLNKIGSNHPLLKDINVNTIGSNHAISREVLVNNKWFKQVINYIPEMNSIRIYNTDITAIKLMGQRQRNFLAILGHELRNPLAAILLLLDFLEPKLVEDQDSQEIFNKIKHQSQNVSDLISDLLDISRIEMSKIELKKQKNNVSTCLRNAFETVKPFLENNNQTLEMIIPANDIFVMADSLRLEQIIINLLNNASKFSSKNSYIKLSLESNDNEVIIKVKDFGIGINSKSIPRIFDLFIQEENSLSQNNDGLGIGLYLTSQLVQLHDGNITCYSEGVGKGSEFVVKLPLLKITKDVKLKSSKPVEKKLDSKTKILVVDDNTTLAETFESVIKSLGFEVKSCTDGNTALKLIKNYQFDIILIDLGMPIMDGLTLAKKIKAIKNLSQPTLIAITGYGQETDKDLARNAGFNNYAIKPIGVKELSKLLLSNKHCF